MLIALGVLPAAMHALDAERGLICPCAQGGEAVLGTRAGGGLAPDPLIALINHFKGSQVLPVTTPRLAEADPDAPTCVT